MQYNFDEIIPRKHSRSYKWDTEENENILPMWVADMDFRTAQPIIDALQKRVQHGIFGYTKVPKEYFSAVTHWFEKRHNFSFSANEILFTTGVVPALSAIIKALTATEDQVIVQSPVYNCFYSSIRNNDCEIISNELIYQEGKYSIDFEDLQEKAKHLKAKLLLLCSPHNPVGRVWSREELIKIGEICIKNNVTVVSDDIHCDLVYPGEKHVPFASISDDFLFHSVTCIAPSKTFNLAGLQVANILASDEEKRRKIDKALNINEVCEINPFAVEAVIAAYNEGEEWLEQLKIYLYENYNFLKDFFQKQLPDFPVMTLEATYLVWIDCAKLNSTSETIAKYLLDHYNILINYGMMYGKGGENFIRINIACSRKLLEEGLLTIKKAFDNYLK